METLIPSVADEVRGKRPCEADVYEFEIPSGEGKSAVPSRGNRQCFQFRTLRLYSSHCQDGYPAGPITQTFEHEREYRAFAAEYGFERAPRDDAEHGTGEKGEEPSEDESESQSAEDEQESDDGEDAEGSEDNDEDVEGSEDDS